MAITTSRATHHTCKSSNRSTFATLPLLILYELNEWAVSTIA